MSAPATPSASVSAREFARLDGCDEKLVRRAIKAGKLPVSGEGRIDPALAGSGWRRQNRRSAKGADTRADNAADTREMSARVSAPNVRTRKARDKGAAPSAAEVEEAMDDVVAAAADDFLARVLAGEFAATWEAERVKENALAARHLITARKDAGSLVDVERAEAVFFEAARGWRDAWIGFPTKFGPLIAADLDLDTDKVVEAVTTYVQQLLEQLGEPIPELTAQE